MKIQQEAEKGRRSVGGGERATEGREQGRERGKD